MSHGKGHVPWDKGHVPWDKGQKPGTNVSRHHQERRGEEKRGEEIRSEPDSLEPAEPASKPIAIVTFPVVGKGGAEWGLDEAGLAALRDSFPATDVLGEVRKALGWIRANPTKRKTAGGMSAFLWRWVERATNRGGGAEVQIKRRADPVYEVWK